MLKMPPPIDPTIAYMEGYYWVQILKFGTVVVVLYKDGHWHYFQREEIGVVEGPLPLPTEEQMASQEAYFAAETAKERALYAHIENPCWFDWVDGYYWVQWDDEDPEIAFVMEDSWQSLNFINGRNEWVFDFVEGNEKTVPVIYGPLIAPKVKRTLHS